MSYTLGEAAKATGKAKPTILNAIKTGRISAKKDDFERWRIEPAELHRIYPPVVKSSSNGLTVLDNTHETATLQAELKSLEAQLELLKSERDNQIELLKSERDDLRLERDRWMQQVTALLEDKRDVRANDQAGVMVRAWRMLFRK